MPADLLSLLRDRVLIFDGAIGTSVHRFHPTPADWGGDHLVNLTDGISLTHSDWILDIHRGFLKVGCDAVETNTFNGAQHVLAEFGLGDKCYELSLLGA